MDEYNNNQPVEQNGSYVAPEGDIYVDNSVAPVEEKKNNVFGIISMVCGIASIIMSCCCTWVAIPLIIAAIVLAFIDKSKNSKMSVFAIVGLICGGVGVLSLVVNIIVGIIIGGSGAFASIFESAVYDDYYYYY